jgi:hypothetical protein
MHPSDLGPLLHADHTLPPRPITRSSEGPDPAGQDRPHAGWVTFRPAQLGQYSGGAHSGGGRRPVKVTVDNPGDAGALLFAAFAVRGLAENGTADAGAASGA